MPRRCRPIATLLFVLSVLLSTAPAFAVDPAERLPDPAQESRARALSEELRCLVCQNQSIDDSNADLARDLRLLVRERIVAGDSDREVLDYLVARYGDFVLLRPRFSGAGLVLWGLPPVLVVIGLAGAVLAWRRRRDAGSVDGGLTADEEKALAALLEADEGPDSAKNGEHGGTGADRSGEVT